MSAYAQHPGNNQFVILKNVREKKMKRMITLIHLTNCTWNKIRQIVFYTLRMQTKTKKVKEKCEWEKKHCKSVLKQGFY